MIIDHAYLKRWAYDTIVDTAAAYPEVWDQYRFQIAAHLRAADIDPCSREQCEQALQDAFEAVVPVAVRQQLQQRHRP